MALLFIGCGDDDAGFDLGEIDSPVVYGRDNREDALAFKNNAWARRAADFSAAMIPTATIDQTNRLDVAFKIGTLQQEFNVCADERFAGQLTAGSCSATLIAPDLMLTAGHCINALSCADNAFVFNYTMVNARRLQRITSDDIYRCKTVLVQDESDHADFAVVRLDRHVKGHTPAHVSTAPMALRANTALVVSGYPSGLPLKIADGARVRHPGGELLDFFSSNLDTFGGNSGAGVFRADTYQQVGILVAGEDDYVQTPEGCQRINRCPDSGCSGETSGYAFRAIDALCKLDARISLCRL